MSALTRKQARVIVAAFAAANGMVIIMIAAIAEIAFNFSNVRSGAR
jgi:hypothetical protein